MVIHRNVWLPALAAILVIPTSAWSRQASQAQGQAAQSSATQPDSLADAARRAKEQKKEEPKSAKVFTNEDLPTNATISVVGTASAPAPAKTSEATPAGAAGSSGEKMWRDKFAKLNHKLEQDQSELDILQRELAILNTQYYGGDPMKGLQQGLSQADITAKRDKIDAKTKDVADDQQAISDAEADLQKAGGDPGWER